MEFGKHEIERFEKILDKVFEEQNQKIEHRWREKKQERFSRALSLNPKWGTELLEKMERQEPYALSSNVDIAQMKSFLEKIQEKYHLLNRYNWKIILGEEMATSSSRENLKQEIENWMIVLSYVLKQIERSQDGK